jgi:hypothetical protein
MSIQGGGRRLEDRRLPEDEGGTSSALSDLTCLIVVLAAPHGYIATARLLGGIRGDRLLLQARRKLAAGYEYLEEVPLETLERLGAVAVGSAFDRAARAAFAAAGNAERAMSRPARG